MLPIVLYWWWWWWLWWCVKEEGDQENKKGHRLHHDLLWWDSLHEQTVKKSFIGKVVPERFQSSHQQRPKASELKPFRFEYNEGLVLVVRSGVMCIQKIITEKISVCRVYRNIFILFCLQKRRKSKLLKLLACSEQVDVVLI